jgi:uncharacterized alkaline shock family protein YloU
MTDTYPRRGKTTIAPDVLNSIARLSALSVSGVARMSAAPVAMDRLFQRGQTDGVRIEIRDHAVLVDLHLVLHHDAVVKEVSREVQGAVARAIQEMVGMDVLEVNIHVEDVAFSDTPPAA